MQFKRHVNTGLVDQPADEFQSEGGVSGFLRATAASFRSVSDDAWLTVLIRCLLDQELHRSSSYSPGAGVAGEAGGGRRAAIRGRPPTAMCRRGLPAVVGRLEDADLPGLSVPHLDHVEALWLLAAPELVIAWAAVYDRAYPVALLELWVAPTVWADSSSMATWLSRRLAA